MLGYLYLAVIKIIDNIVSTTKSICVYQEKKILSSILVVISQFLFYFVIDQVVNDGSLLIIIIASVSSGIGNYFAFPINNKFKRDSKWAVALTCSDINDVKELCHYLREHGIKYLANDGYDKECRKTINVLAFSKTKEQSRLIDNYIENTDNKYFKEVLK